MVARVIHIEGDSKTYVEELDAFAINYHVFNGIVKQPAYQGISESFKQIIIESDGLDEVLIFEDDVRFTSAHAREGWNKCIEKLPKGWDILLGGSYHYDLHEDQPVDKTLLRVKDFSSLHCVLINSKCFEHVLSHDVNNIKHIDRHLGDLAKNGIINVYLCNPQIAIQYNGFSRTRNKDVNYDHLLTDKNILHD